MHADVPVQVSLKCPPAHRPAFRSQVTNGGVGTHLFYVLTVRHANKQSNTHMLVSDKQGACV